MDLMTSLVYNPNTPLRIVGADSDLVRSVCIFEEVVPQRPRLDKVATRVDDEDAVPEYRGLPQCAHAD